ncbi:glutathione S-transferase [Rhodobacteraceae bacterium RKSG542]|nr:glutathione S-transferase [Pseudovibrio flavus]
MLTGQLPILYSFRRCPYAIRARMALVSSGKSVALREIVLRAKPAHMLEISPKGTVPVLQLVDGTVIDESLDVMLWALGQNDPDSWLTPQHGSLADMKALIALMDGAFKHHLDRYKYATRYEGADPDSHYTSAIDELKHLDERLKEHRYLFGERPSLADQALFPFVRQFANADNERFEDAAPEKVKTWLGERITCTEFQQAFGTKWKPWAETGEALLFPTIA